MHEILQISHAVLLDSGEDSFSLRSDGQSAFLCVTDGCGGLGSKRYSALDNRTGAWIAAKLAARAFADWAQERGSVPTDEEEGKLLCTELSDAVYHVLKGFADEHCAEKKGRIVGSMQRRLPTTLCSVTIHENRAAFWWAGDSRGYVMDENGLHQLTRDHVRGQTDAFETLYRDAPLSNLLSADQKGRILLRVTSLKFPSVVLVATDGVYSSLPTPMEVEMLLLDTLKKAKSMREWERCLCKRVAANAQDDATLLLLPVGFETFEQLKSALLPRREILQKRFITPVRRRRGDIQYAREKWLQYKPDYDCTEDAHG